MPSWTWSSRRISTPRSCTATSITFGTHQPLTGLAAPGYDEIAAASQAYFNYVNAHGGVFGRKVHLIIKDDAYGELRPYEHGFRVEVEIVSEDFPTQDGTKSVDAALQVPRHTFRAHAQGPRVAESSLGLIAGWAFSAPYEDVRLKTR